MTKYPICEICKKEDWYLLPLAKERNSVATSGIIVKQPLGKAQCTNCGFVQRIADKFLGSDFFYEENYQTYYNRVGAKSYDKKRYELMAQWIIDSLHGYIPQKAVDIGCGQGWLLKEMSIRLPNTNFIGIEPSIENSRMARKEGLCVSTGKLEELKQEIGVFDFVYSTNVIQHTNSVRAFLKDMIQIVTKEGYILIICPDATVPSNEMMWCDQNFSLAPQHLIKIAHDYNLKIIAWRKPPADARLLDKQLILLSRKKHKSRDRDSDKPPTLNILQNISHRESYVASWLELDSLLNERINPTGNVYNFGASMWSYLLRGYCPEYWKHVKACIVDNFSGIFMDRTVIEFDWDVLHSRDTVVLGINPTIQPHLLERFKKKRIDVVAWFDKIKR
jgi:2-polyprenyl-3-methyl-5-hydroxy-6-metoxy-1,4-benzoquinol methylase